MKQKVSAASRAWQHVDGPSDDAKKRNRFLSPPFPQPQAILASPINLEGFIKMNNLKCYDSEGHVAEYYPQLYVAKDIFRENNTSPQGEKYARKLLANQAISHCECNSLFLPSLPLTCAILIWLHEHAHESPEMLAVLNQYIDYGNGCGEIRQNTAIDFTRKKVIHYYQGIRGEETNQRMLAIEMDFSIDSGIFNFLDLFNNPDTKQSIQNLTGLQNSASFQAVSEYFGKSLILNSRHHYSYSPLVLGCMGDFFSMSAEYLFYELFAARGVKVEGDGK